MQDVPLTSKEDLPAPNQGDGLLVMEPWYSLSRLRNAAIAAELWRHREVYGALGLCGLVLLFRLSLIDSGGAPSGSDPGNWLAFGHELFGERVKAATTTYPPVVPALTKGLLLFFPPLFSISILGAVASVTMGVPFFLLVRQSAGTSWAFLFTLGLLFLGYSGEMVAWGGYPQLLGQAFLLFALYWLGKGLLENRRLFLFLGAASASLGVGTSVLVLGFLVVTVPLFTLFILVRERVGIRYTARRLLEWGVMVAGLSLVFLPSYVDTFRLQEGRAWNPSGYEWGTAKVAFAYLFKEWPGAVGVPLLLLPLALVLTMYCVWTRARGSLLAPASASMMLASLAIFFTSFEVRSLNLFQIGMLGALALLLPHLFIRVKQADLHKAIVRFVRGGVVTMAIVLVAFLVVLGHQRTVESFDWYRVLDDDVVEALDWMEQNVEPGSVTVASSTPQGYQYGWWIEGYSRRPAYSATDPRWLIFKEEKQQTAIANALLASASGAEAASIAEQHRIGYIFLDKRVVKDPSRLEGISLTTAFENQTVQVLEFTLVQTDHLSLCCIRP